jgi:hypothetical protein
MPSENPCNYWIFREGRRTVSGESVRAGLASSLAKLAHLSRDALLDALLRGGELEAALADSGSDHSHAAAGITNAVAAGLVGLWTAESGLESLAEVACQVPIPSTLSISTAEGFAYYALNPLQFADLVAQTPISSPRVAVIGIRSIGATLSAVVAAALARRNIRAERITVRPGGHPYDRRTEFTPAQLRWIAAHRSHRAEFLVVDEGPGLSGSSFLSVGEALLEAGVERRMIRFLCSHEADPEHLVSPNAAQRWRGFQVHATSGSRYRPSDAADDIGGGNWRNEFFGNEAEWPASWISMERSKFLSQDRQRFYKFAGLGKYGEDFATGANVLAERGFGPRLLRLRDGYAEFNRVHGRPATREDLSSAVIERIADYCALRLSEFQIPGREPSPLDHMMRFNFEQVFGDAPPEWFSLAANQPVLCDAHMQPHEWILDSSGTLLKTDGESHGDDHFLPGPTDIAWDLAGAIIEWEMDDDEAEALLRHFRSRTNVEPRSPQSFLLGYALFRHAYCTMAAHALRGSSEHSRLVYAAGVYRAAAEKVLRSSSTPTPAFQSSFSAADD